MKVEISDLLFNEEELTNTPGRYQGFMDEWERNRDFEFTLFENQGYDQMIMLKDIEFSSLCSHHVLPFHGVAHIGYLPDKMICGISKLARAVDCFASKPQLQERMTKEIADFLVDQMHPLGCIVIVEAAHDCMRIRGVKKQNSVMVTSAIRGEFLRSPELKAEFMQLIHP